MTFKVTVQLLILAAVLILPTTDANKHSTTTTTIRLPGRKYDHDDDFGDDKHTRWAGQGREFDLFDSRTTTTTNTAKDTSDKIQHTRGVSSKRPLLYHYAGGGGSSSKRRFHVKGPKFIQSVEDWWQTSISPNIKSLPRIQCRVEPTTTLKIRKTFRPLKTILRFGADFNTQLGVWQFKSSWEDALIGGKITLAGRELQLTKSWQLSVGAVEDLVTRLRFRAAVDLQTWKAYARVGFRTERLSPINIMEGFTLSQELPLDGNDGHIKLEVRANFALPEPEIEYSTEAHRSLVGMGDIEVNIDELNLVLDY